MVLCATYSREKRGLARYFSHDMNGKCTASAGLSQFILVVKPFINTPSGSRRIPRLQTSGVSPMPTTTLVTALFNT